MLDTKEEKLKKELDKKREEMMQKLHRLKVLKDNPATGWQDFIEILDQYIAFCKRKKATTRLDTADARLIEQLRFMDNYVSALEWVRQVPVQAISNIEDKLDEIKRSEENKVDSVFIQ